MYASTYEYLASRKRHKLSEFDNYESMILTLQDFAFTHIWTFKKCSMWTNLTAKTINLSDNNRVCIVNAFKGQVYYPKFGQTLIWRRQKRYRNLRVQRWIFHTYAKEGDLFFETFFGHDRTEGDRIRQFCDKNPRVKEIIYEKCQKCKIDPST